jgi:hypothetical protein
VSAALTLVSTHFALGKTRDRTCETVILVSRGVAAKAVDVFDTVGHVLTLLPHIGKVDRSGSAGASASTCTSTTVPSLIGTSWRA